MSDRQNIITKPGTVAEVKAKMMEGKFDFEAVENRIGGSFHTDSQVYFVYEGHSRLCAALEIAHSTGNWAPFNQLITHGRWDDSTLLPGVHRRYPLPFQNEGMSRRELQSWTAFMKPITPGWREFGILNSLP